MFRLLVGRGPQADLKPESKMVSRRHAELVNGDEGWVLKDLQSDNGTFVNGIRIQSCFLKSGDKVSFADAAYRFSGVELVPEGESGAYSAKVTETWLGSNQKWIIAVVAGVVLFTTI